MNHPKQLCFFCLFVVSEVCFGNCQVLEKVCGIDSSAVTPGKNLEDTGTGHGITWAVPGLGVYKNLVTQLFISLASVASRGPSGQGGWTSCPLRTLQLSYESVARWLSRARHTAETPSS